MPGVWRGRLTTGRSSYPSRGPGPRGGYRDRSVPNPTNRKAQLVKPITISETEDMPRGWSPLTLKDPHDGAPTIVTADDGRYLIVTPDYDRRAFTCDDDAHAIYEVNREAAADAFGLDRFAPLLAGGRWWLTVPIVDDNDERESVDTLVDLCGALADYPILDDSAYCERDAAAWQDCWADWARGEVGRAMLDALAPYLTADTFDVAELLESAPWDAAAHTGMAYYYGLSGEYDQDGATAGALAMLAGMGELFATMSTIGQTYNGMMPLPFPR